MTVIQYIDKNLKKMSISNHYIQSVSYAKLAEYDQNRTDLPIRKYVLIANLLREEQQQQQRQEESDTIMNSHKDDEEDEDILMLEQQWFETCLNELDKEDDDTDPKEEIDNNGQYNHQQSNNMISINQKIYNTNQPRIQLHAIYDMHNKRGILLCTSSI